MDYCPGLVQMFACNECKVTAIASHEANGVDVLRLKALFDSNQLSLNQTESPERYKESDRYHYSFGVYPFNITETEVESLQASPVIVTDEYHQWRISLGKNERKAPVHLVGLESLMNATLVGGYFAAILPTRWIGREMKYLRWWQERAACVARIKLPEESVLINYKTDAESPPVFGSNRNWLGGSRCNGAIVSPCSWELVIFQRPLDTENLPREAKENGAPKIIPFSEMRFPTFIWKLRSLSQESIGDLSDAFKNHEWRKISINLWLESIKKYNTNSWCGTYRTMPHGVGSDDKIIAIKPSDDKKVSLIIASKEEIANNERGVGVKVTSSKIKLVTYNPTAAGVMLEYKFSKGTKLTNKGKEWDYVLDDKLKRSQFSEVQSELLSELESAGLELMMTPDDYRKLVKRNSWIERHLTPVERWIPTQDVKDGDSLSSDEDKWELIYEESGKRALFQDQYKQWMSRASKIKLTIPRGRPGSVVNEYQLDDIMIMCMQSRSLLGWMMGLGKTRGALFAAVLRGITTVPGKCKGMFIVCPAKLVDTWKKEIQATIAPWAMRVRANWNGEPLPIGVNVITSARDFKRENLKFFNIMSIDTLKRTPRDATFYQCPKCGTIACQMKPGAMDVMRCPGIHVQNESERCDLEIVRWKNYCTENNLRKIKVLRDENGPVLKANGDFVRVHWNPNHPSRVSIPESSTMVIDQRPPRPKVQVMMRLDNVCKKMTPYISLGKNGEDVIKWEERGMHVKWTFSELARWAFNMVLVDEAYLVNNDESARSLALNHVCGRVRIAATGTPIKGYPQKILPILNWLLPRQVYPDYRPDDPEGINRFMKKYETTVTILREGEGVVSEDGTVYGGKKKQIPKVNNPELFQAELSPFFIRRIRTEPMVVKSVPRKTVRYHDESVEMDEDHREFYKKWIVKFSEWYEAIKAESEGKRVKANILVKLGYLYKASTCPHYMLEEASSKTADTEFIKWAREIGSFNGKPVAKIRSAWSKVLTIIRRGEKVIHFVNRTRNADLCKAWAAKSKVGCVVVDGRSRVTTNSGETYSQRELLIDSFRNSRDINYMAAGISALAEGVNIPEANHGIVTDPVWEPTVVRQAIGRMLRIQQDRVVHAYTIMHKGTIDEYMTALCYLKGRSADEAIDYMEFDDLKCEMIPDVHQYAQSIVDGTEEVVKAKMWMAIEHLREKADQEGEDV